jgi:hypothetical protein
MELKGVAGDSPPDREAVARYWLMSRCVAGILYSIITDCPLNYDITMILWTCHNN